MKTIGEKIRESRARKNLTQAELAEKSGLTIRTVSKYETETVVPRGRNLYKLAEVLGVSEAYLSRPDVEDPSYGLDEAEPLAQTLPMPCVIKTIGGGSSLGVYLPEDRTELKRALEEVLRYGAKVLAEERIYGRELTDAVLGERYLPPVETFPSVENFDYEAKYQAGGAKEICPAELTEEQAKAVGEMALRVHKALGLAVYSRTDMIMDENGQLWCLEANSLPGMTPTSFVPKEAAAVGISYDDLCEEIVRQSLKIKRR